jgi:Ca-activated chloride channel family protein
MIVEREDQYQIFLIFALILLVAEMFVRRKDKPNASLLACLAAFFLFTGFFENSQDTVKKGNDHFQNKQYQSALEDYRKVQIKNPETPEVLYNLGTALYKVDSFQESAKDLDIAAAKAADPQMKAKALYNYGNAQYRLGNFENAIESYKKALEIDPTDKDSKYNLEFLQKQKNNFEKKNQDRKKDDPKKDDQEQQQEQQQKNQDQQKQGQGQEDQENQGQGQQDNQDQKPQNDPQQNQDQKDQQQKPQPDQQDQQKDQQGEKDKEQQQKEQEQKEKEEKEKEEQQQREQEQKDQEKKDQEQSQENEQKSDQEKQQGQAKQPLQGQMSMDNALNLLDALKESEKELQDLRRPPVNKNPPPVEKDW